MAVFKVGQRVRILRSNAWPELAGREGTVIGFSNGEAKEGHASQHRQGIGEYYEVRPDGFQSNLLPLPKSRTGNAFFQPTADQLEPIQYDGNKVIEWSECLWQPSHETA